MVARFFKDYALLEVTRLWEVATHHTFLTGFQAPSEGNVNCLGQLGVYGTTTVVKRDPRHNVMENSASLGVSVRALYAIDPFMLISK
jgi:hypothetical protein